MRAAFLFALAFAACSQPATETSDAPPVEASAPPRTPQEGLAAMPSWADARAQGVDFRAVGQEPGWLLDIYARGIIKLVWNYGENYSEFAIAEPTYPQEGATRYEAHSDGVALVVTIRRFPCNDGMSGEAYPSTVEVVVDSTTLRGCGRSV